MWVPPPGLTFAFGDSSLSDLVFDVQGDVRAKVTVGGLRANQRRWYLRVVPTAPHDKETKCSVSMSYSFSPRRHHPQSEVRYLSWRHLPICSSGPTVTLPTPKVPWLVKPDLFLRVQCEDQAVSAIGPRYNVFPTEREEEYEFGFYQGASYNRIEFGPFEEVESHDGDRILRLRGATLRPADLDGLSTFSRRVRSEFVGLYGPPPVRNDGLLFVSDLGVQSHCVGSTIVLNSLLRSREAYLGCSATIIHEWAHTWWTFGAIVDSLDLATTIGETLTTLAQLHLLSKLGDQELLAIGVGHQLSKPVAAAQKEIEWFRGAGTSYSAIKAVSLLLDAVAGRGVPSVLLRLWNQAHHEAINLRGLRMAFDSLGSALGELVQSAIEDPRPIVARLRVRFSESTRKWTLVVRPQASDRASLIRRLEAMPDLARVCSGRSEIELSFPDRDSLMSASNRIRTFHIVEPRELRIRSIRRRPTLRHLWDWSSKVARSSTTRPWGRLQLLLASLLAIVLNTEDPTGFGALARLFSGRANRFFSELSSTRETHW